MAGALDGIKILELTRVGPGAFCTMMLGDMGADILKIERSPAFQKNPGKSDRTSIQANSSIHE